MGVYAQDFSLASGEDRMSTRVRSGIAKDSGFLSFQLSHDIAWNLGLSSKIRLERVLLQFGENTIRRILELSI